MGGTLIIDNYYLPGTDKNNLRPNEYSGIITYQYEESAEAQHATQVARDATLEGIKYSALFWLLFLTDNCILALQDQGYCARLLKEGTNGRTALHLYGCSGLWEMAREMQRDCSIHGGI